MKDGRGQKVSRLCEGLERQRADWRPSYLGGRTYVASMDRHSLLCPANSARDRGKSVRNLAGAWHIPNESHGCSGRRWRTKRQRHDVAGTVVMALAVPTQVGIHGGIGAGVAWVLVRTAGTGDDRSA